MRNHGKEVYKETIVYDDGEHEPVEVFCIGHFEWDRGDKFCSPSARFDIIEWTPNLPHIRIDLLESQFLKQVEVS